MADLLSTTIAGTLNVTQGATITSNLFVSNTDIIPEINKYTRALSNLNYDHVSAWYSTGTNFIDYGITIPAGSGGSPQGLFVNPAGTQLFVIDSTGDRIQQFRMTQAYNVASAVYEGNLSVAAQETAPTDLFFSNTGTILYIVGSAGDRIEAYDLTVAYNVIASNTFVAGNGFSVFANTGAPDGIHLNSNGKFLYVVANPSATADVVYRYTLNTAWNVATANTGNIDTLNLNSIIGITAPSSISLNPSGTRMFVVNEDEESLYQFDLSTPFLVSTAKYTGKTHLWATFNETGTSAIETVPTGFFYEPNSNTAYYTGETDDLIRSARIIPGTLVSNSLVIDGKLHVYDGMEVNRASIFTDSAYFKSTAVVDSNFTVLGTTTLGTTSIGGGITHSGAASALGTVTSNSDYSFGPGATVANRIKNISIGTGGLAQSNTNIQIGSASGGNTNVSITANTVFVNNRDLLPAIDSAANTVRISQNSGSTLSARQLNFINTANVTIEVTDSGDGNANVAIFTAGGTGSGVQGVQGAPGAQGVQGEAGPQGVQGQVGAQGVQGLVGPQGVQGLVGAQGVQGLVGPQGVQGLVGAQGVQGFVGAQGVQGLVGPQGVQGLVGTQGVQGTIGAQGVQGAIGAQGVQGQVGVQGADGLIGTQGVQGTIGAQGVQGLVGTQGVQGTIGAQGVQGQIGAQGVQGLIGTQGVQGTIGAQGVQGTIGVQGIQGSSGLTNFPVSQNSISTVTATGVNFVNTSTTTVTVTSGVSGNANVAVSVIKSAIIFVGTTAPSSPAVGDLWVDTN